MKINIISCVDNNLGYSLNGKLPWNNCHELKYFYSKINGHIVIIGDKTYHGLPERCLLRNSNQFHIIKYSYFIEHSNEFQNDKIYIIGGIKTINYFFQYYRSKIRKFYLSKLDNNYDCDYFFPDNIMSYFDNYYDKKVKKTKWEFTKIIYKKIENNDKPYLRLMSEILLKNNFEENRTEITSCSLFGRHIKYDLRMGFPLLTTKYLSFKNIIEELLFFISGSTNCKDLENKGVFIWSGNTSRQFLDSRGLNNYSEGDMGPMYGFQWRHAGEDYIDCSKKYHGIDQLKNVISLIREEPNSRRMLIINLDVRQESKMVLQPCHCLVQFYVEGDYLDANMYQRSADLFLGVPYNIASYSALLVILGNLTNKIPRFITIYFGNVHVYSNHVTQCNIQLERKPYKFPSLRLNKKYENIEDISRESFILEDYRYFPSLKAEMAV